MSLIRIKNETLIDKREATYLTAAVAAAGTSLTVADNNNFLTDNNYYLLGAIGTEGAEIVQNNGGNSAGTTITVDAITFAHPIGTPIYRLDYNQFRLAHSTSTSTDDIDAANVVTAAIQFDDTYTRYQDSTYTTGYFFVRFYNSTTTTFSDYSSAIPVGGHSQLSLWEIARRVYRHLGMLTNDDMDESQVKFNEVKRAINDKQRDIVHERLWTFAEGEYSFSTVANQFLYSPDTTKVAIINNVSHDSKPLKYLDRQEWDMLHVDTDTTSTYSTHFSVWNNDIYLYPKPSTAASTTTLNEGAQLSAIDTTLTVASTSGFRSTGGFYRFIIDSEVIYATGITSTTFTGCLRGQEGTTAATHTDASTVTERDIVFGCQVEPTDLSNITDTTIVPEPDALAIGAAEDIARGTLKDNALADRLQSKYEKSIVNLRNKFSKKVATSFKAVKDVLDTVEARSMINPNDYPTGLS